MQQLRNYGDQRQLMWCVHCGGDPTTRDHVPSKVLLDDPLPTNLPVVPTCERCNHGFSLDEEYFACLLECTLAGSAAESEVRREKIKQILRRSPDLESRLDRAHRRLGSSSYFCTEISRVRNVVLKLARGHSAFDLNEPHCEEPTSLTISPLCEMVAANRAEFESRPFTVAVWPEVGSRAMQRLIVDSPDLAAWTVVQPDRYRYLAAVEDGVLIRMVLSEYLACEVRW